MADSSSSALHPTTAQKKDKMSSHVMFFVTVPAKLLRTPKKGSDSSETSVTVHSLASKVRKFIVDHPDCEFISEEAFLNGKAWWTSFMFACKDGSQESCVTGLNNEGVGDTHGGRGMIHVLPLSIQRIGSRPKVCGRPDDLEYKTPGSPPVSPAPTPSTPERKTPTRVSFAEEETKAKEAPEMVTTASGEVTMTGSRDEVVDMAESYGLEFEDEDEMIQAQLMAELEESQRKDEGFLKRYAGSFTDTIEARVAVDNVVQVITAGTKFTFDYVMLCIVAGMIAVTGLVTNNAVVVVASMLVSPLMGPILAVTFGHVVRDRDLVNQGLFSECVGLVLCILVGFLGGLCAAPANGDTWATTEMASRGIVSALYTGVAIAIPSGIGAALSVLGNNQSSLVGVAISASLLPPAVNCGILLAGAAVHPAGLVDYTSNPVNVGGRWVTLDPWAAAISFGVTLINIILIFITAAGVFELKCLGSGTPFWSRHVRKARKFNQALRESNAHIYRQAFASAKARRGGSDASTYFSPLEKLRASSWHFGGGFLAPPGSRGSASPADKSSSDEAPVGKSSSGEAPPVS